jgi:hypothetical protein
VTPALLRDRERWRTLALALGALLATAALYGGGWAPDLQRVSRPTTADAGRDGYAALRRHLERRGVAVVSLREPLGAGYAAEGPMPVGDLLVLTLPGTRALRADELTWVDRWVRAGNTLVVLAAVRDRPAWAVRAAGAARFELSALTGLEPAGQARPGPTLDAARTTGALPWFEDIARLAAVSDVPLTASTLRAPPDGALLQLAVDARSGEGVLWLRASGAGRIVVSALGSLFGHRALARQDNARVFAAILESTVAPGGRVVFDDYRHGVGQVLDPRQVLEDPRVRATLAALLVLWALWVVGGTPLRAAAGPAAAPGDAATSLRTRAAFFARTVDPASAARSLLGHAATRLLRPGAVGPMSTGAAGEIAQAEALLQRVRSNARIPRADADTLQALVAAVRDGRPVRLGALHNLLLRIERNGS